MAKFPVSSVGAWTCALVLAWSVPALADDADEADLHFRVGAERYEAADYRGALEHFLASNRLAPNRNVLFNIARSFEQLKQAPDAYRYYWQALDGETDAAARKRVNDALARIAPNVATLQVETSPPGATVYLDRKDLGGRGQAPRTLGLAAGKHRVLAELPGYEQAVSAEVDLRLGVETKVSLKLLPILGTVKVEGSPVGAEVRIDGEEGSAACILPCSATTTPGRHTLFVSRPGFQTFETQVDVPARGSVNVRARMSAQTGTLVVNSDIREALISVDGETSGFTPAVLALPVGKHKVRVSLSGFRTSEREVVVSRGKQVTLDLVLSNLEEVTAASRVSESVEDAPASVTIITSQELRAMGYPTVAEALRGVRGLYLSDDRSYVSLGVRGFGNPGDFGNRVLVTIDGHPTNDNYISSSYIGFDGRVDLDDIERIEVVRGPGSVLYGTSAFFAVINLVTRERTVTTHGEAALSAAEYGVGRARATGVVKLGEHAGLWNSVSVARGAGRDFYYPEFAGNPTDPNAARGANGLVPDGNVRGRDGFDAGTVNGRAWYKSATVQWLFHTRQKDLPTAGFDTVFGGRTRFSDTRGFVEGRFEPKLSEQVQLLSRAHANLYSFNGTYAYEPTDGGVTREAYRGVWAGIEQRVQFTPTSKIRLTAGGELIRHFNTTQRGTDNTGQYFPTRNDPFTVGAAYVSGDFEVHRRVRLSAGARLDYYSNLDQFDFLPAFNPRVAVIVKPYTRGNLKIMGGKAFRAPSVYEQFYLAPTQEPSVNLQPEQVYSGEAEFTHRFSPTVTATAAGYTNYVSDLIELGDVVTPTGEERVQYRNSSAPVLVFGSELELKRDFRDGWMLGATYSLQRAQYMQDPTLRRVPNSPVHLGSLKAGVPMIGRILRGMTRLSVEGGRPDRNKHDTDAPQGFTTPGVVWDLVLSGEVERFKVRYNLGVYNVADWRYDTVPSGEFRQRTMVQSGRTFLASLGASF